MFSKSTRLAQMLLIISGLLFFLSNFFPLWEISLWAPQYPEGLSLQIWTSKFTGDVQTINVLNHYVGMHPINVDTFPELKFFPTAFLIFAIAGIVTGIINRKITTYIWTIVLVAAATWAMVDFYNWEYKFGHDLNPDAPIKMDDMVYQPPLIGTKLFLNITASSFPALTGYALILSNILTLVATVITFRKKNETT